MSSKENGVQALLKKKSSHILITCTVTHIKLEASAVLC